MSPEFLSVEQVLVIHSNQLRRYGGQEGILDLGRLESAVAMPRSGMAGGYFHKDLFEMAAAYVFYLVSGHPFIDGNKRTGAVAADLFLELNGYELQGEVEPEFQKLILEVASGTAGKELVIGFFRQHTRPLR